MVCIPLTTQATKFSWAKIVSSDLYCNDSTNLLCLATSANDVNSFHCEYHLNTPTFCWDYSHIVPLNQIKVTSKTWSSIVYNLVVSGASGVIWDLHYVVHVPVTFSLGSLLTYWKYPHSQNGSWNDFWRPSVQALHHPLRVSLTCTCSLFCPLLPSTWYAG